MHIKIMISSSLRCCVLNSHKIQCINFSEIVNVSSCSHFDKCALRLSDRSLFWVYHLKRESCFPGRNAYVQAEIRVPYIFTKQSFIPVSGLCDRFWQVELICMINANNSGRKFTIPEFRLPFAQTVNQPVGQCYVNGKQAIFTCRPSFFCLTVL